MTTGILIRLKETKKQKSIAEEGKQKAEGTLQRLKDEHNTTKQKLQGHLTLVIGGVFSRT